MQALRVPAIERWVRRVEGLRVAVAESLLRNPFGVPPYAPPPHEQDGERERRVARGAEYLEHWITERHPVARMMDATLAMARERGVPVLVFAAPINVPGLRRQGLYDRERHLEGMAVLRDITERRGGTFVDLHAGVLPTQFRDLGGHYNAAGMRRLAMALRPRLADALGIPRPASAADWPRMRMQRRWGWRPHRAKAQEGSADRPQGAPRSDPGSARDAVAEEGEEAVLHGGGGARSAEVLVEPEPVPGLE
jgi:hypothetical protein